MHPEKQRETETAAQGSDHHALMGDSDTTAATHVRPQPGPSDWLLLPACCSLDRSMCSTYV